MNHNLKKAFRTVQVRFPALRNVKSAAGRYTRKLLRTPVEADFLALQLFPTAKDAVYLDVGANRGQSAEAILLATQSGRIHLFEPNPLLSTKLEQQYRKSPRVAVHHFGLGEHPATTALYIPRYKKWDFDGLASLDEQTARAWLPNRIYFFRPEDLTITTVPCRIRTLDELNLAPFFAKLDVQGHELFALRGARKTLENHEPILLVESPKPPLLSFLDSLGYTPYAFADRRFLRGTLGKCNTFFMTESKSRVISDHIIQ